MKSSMTFAARCEPAGPHANAICRFFVLTVLNSCGNTKSRRFNTMESAGAGRASLAQCYAPQRPIQPTFFTARSMTARPPSWNVQEAAVSPLNSRALHDRNPRRHQPVGVWGELGMQALVTKTLMQTEGDKVNLAREIVRAALPADV